MQNIDPVMKRDRAERTAGIARLKWRGKYLKWSPTGYRYPKPIEDKTTVTVLTPACTVKVLAAGYAPEVQLTGV